MRVKVRAVIWRDGRVVVGPLVYVAEVVDAYHLHELNLVFDAAPANGGPVDGLQLVDVAGWDRDFVRPPILEAIAADAAGGWPPPARWLGNVYQAAADR